MRMQRGELASQVHILALNYNNSYLSFCFFYSFVFLTTISQAVSSSFLGYTVRKRLIPICMGQLLGNLISFAENER